MPTITDRSSGEVDESTNLIGDTIKHRPQRQPPTFTVRSTAVGAAIGSLVCLSNTYFGLQNGNSDGMAAPSALLGFAFFRLIQPTLKTPFEAAENSYLQTVASAVGSVPLTAGLISIVVALEYLLHPSEGGPVKFSYNNLVTWTLGLCSFGMFFALFLRKHILEREKLRFPTATATGTIIAALHRSGKQTLSHDQVEEDRREHAPVDHDDESATLISSRSAWSAGVAFMVSGLTALCSARFPVLYRLPIFGSVLGERWLWTFSLSPGIFGQGMITGPLVTLHMLAGTIVGWAILSPMASQLRWAPGDVSDWDRGSRGWIIWIGTATLLTDSFINIAWMGFRLEVVQSFVKAMSFAAKSRSLPLLPHDQDGWERRTSPGAIARRRHGDETACNYADQHNDSPSCPSPKTGKQSRRLMSIAHNNYSVAALLLVSMTGGVVALVTTLHHRVAASTIVGAIFASFFLSVASVRAMGQTDYSPVSGLGKLLQFIFALLVSGANPQRFVLNLTVGAIAEAASLQAAILMASLKTGGLVGADIAGQFLGHVIGTLIGVFIASGLYKVYTNGSEVPGPVFQTPTAFMWLIAAKLAYGSGLPPHCLEFIVGFATLWTIITILKIRYPSTAWIQSLPSGVAFAVGMYVAPAFTLPRVLGGIFFWLGRIRLGLDPMYMKLLAAGLILGESVFSLAGLLLPH